MYAEKNKNSSVGNVRLFGNIRVLVASALFIALSIAFGKLLAFNIGDSIRISFENLPILMAGIFFGPVIGAAVGVGADVIGCIIVGYSINPIITAGAACIGLVSGLVSMFCFRDKLMPRLAMSVYAAHIVGSMIVKSIGLYVFYHTPIKVLLLRVPLYIGIGLLEFYIIYLLLSNKSFSRELSRLKGDNIPDSTPEDSDEKQ